MAYIRKRKKSYSVVYRVNDADGTEHQKSEGYTTLKEAEKRKKEIEYKQSLGTFVVPKCTKVKELIKEYVRIYGHNEWGVATYDGNIGLINNYIIPTIGEVQLSEINNHFMEKYYTDLLKMPAVKSSRNSDGDKLITAATVHQIHKVLRSCFRQAVKWDMMDRNPATDATLPKYKAEEREIWTAEMLMQAIDACENKWLKVAFHLAFAATVRLGELLGLTWDCVDISEEAISENRAYVFINKQVERVSKEAVEELDSKEVILIFPSQRKNNKTVRVLKTPKTDTSERKVYIPGVVNLELEVLKMKIIIIFIDLLMATVLFFVGRFFIKSRNTEISVLFLSGDYTGLNTEKICRVTGKRIKTWAMLFCLGGIIDFIKLGAGIIIVSVFFIILLVFHLVDMTINRDKYRV